MSRIVVGIDESAPSKAALRWAIEEATLRKADLHVVVTWNHPVVAAAEPIIVPMPDTETLVATAKTTADHLISESGLAESGLVYKVLTPEGRAGEELVTCAKDADLLVVGSHGSGALKELLLGSVSNYVAHHSRCPVVLVRTPD